MKSINIHVLMTRLLLHVYLNFDTSNDLDLVPYSDHNMPYKP